MAKLLYITCDLNPIERSRSLTVGSDFLNEYLRRNPKDEVNMLDLYRDNNQRLDADVLSGFEKLRAGHHFAALTSDEQRKIGRIWRRADQFVAADKYLFVASVSDLGFPVELRMYLDTVCVANKTYHSASGGPEGLLKNQGRKCLMIHATKGPDFDEMETHSVSYLSSVMKLMGIDELETFAVQEYDTVPGETGGCRDEETRKAVQHASRF